MKIVEKENILIEDEILNKDTLILKMIKNLKFEEKITNNIFKEVLEREKIDNTVLGFGVSIPHSKSENIKNSHIVYCKLNKAISWEDGEEDVDKILLILVPKDSPDKHIEVLKEISTKIMKKEFRDKLNDTNDVDEIYEILNS